MSNLNYLFGSTPPPSVTSTVASTNGLPDWYQQYLSGIAAQGTNIAGSQQNAPLPTQSVAGFNPTQQKAQGMVESNVGAWQPLTGQAAGVAGQIAPGVTGAVQNANAAVAGPAQTWNAQTAQQYMSPYTQSVVENIATQGNNNWNNNIMPGINAAMIGTGGFGSTRNAVALGQGAALNQQNITNAQSQALQQGYTGAEAQFSADANRTQQQQQMQGSAALQGAGALTSGLGAAATQLGNLGQSYSALGLGDAQALNAVGTQQQQLQQQGLDTNYANAQAAQAQPWNNLNNLNSIVRGLQLPTNSATTASTPTTAAQPGALGALGAAYGAAKA